MEKYIFEMNEDAKNKIEKIIKLFGLDVHISEQQIQEEKEWPQDVDDYYYIHSDGSISRSVFYLNDSFCKNTLSIGNCFRTREEAEFEAERLKVLAEMKKFAEPEDRKWDGENQHWVIYLNIYNGSINIDYYTIHKYDLIYFESAEKAEECVKAIGIGKIRKYYLGVEFKE
jgi:hypothetical protein